MVHVLEEALSAGWPTVGMTVTTQHLACFRLPAHFRVGILEQLGSELEAARNRVVVVRTLDDGAPSGLKIITVTAYDRTPMLKVSARLRDLAKENSTSRASFGRHFTMLPSGILLRSAVTRLQIQTPTVGNLLHP